MRDQEGSIVRISLSAINEDVSTQCRIAIDPNVINEYAEAMANGTAFPPPIMFGTFERCWIGDGWHRIAAARKNGATDIAVLLHSGDRVDALRCALKANSSHGLRRSKADKRRAVELALKEFGSLSDRQISVLCDVSHTLVSSVRAGGNNATCSVRLGADGKQYTVNAVNLKPSNFDVALAKVRIRQAIGGLYERCPADRRDEIGSAVLEITKEVFRVR